MVPQVQTHSLVITLIWSISQPPKYSGIYTSKPIVGLALCTQGLIKSMSGFFLIKVEANRSMSSFNYVPKVKVSNTSQSQSFHVKLSLCTQG